MNHDRKFHSTLKRGMMKLYVRMAPISLVLCLLSFPSRSEGLFPSFFNGLVSRLPFFSSKSSSTEPTNRIQGDNNETTTLPPWTFVTNKDSFSPSYSSSTRSQGWVPIFPPYATTTSYRYFPDPLTRFIREKSPTFHRLLRNIASDINHEARTFFLPDEEAFLKASSGNIFSGNERLILHHLLREPYSHKDLLKPPSVLSTLLSIHDRIRINGNKAVNSTFVNGVKIIDSVRIESSYLYILGGVLPFLPEKDVLHILRRDGRFDTFLSFANLFGVDLSVDPITVFAPTDEAFLKVPYGYLDNGTGLLEVLTRHFCKGSSLLEFDLTTGDIECFLKSKIKFKNIYGQVIINNETRIVEGGIFASNGIIHVVDSVLL